MQARNLKFVCAILVLLATVVWLGMSGYQEGKAYYLTVAEVNAMGEEALSRRIMLMGHLVPGSIEHSDGRLRFSLSFDEAVISVVYEGSAPVPDTFREGQEIQALVEGRMNDSGHFVGQRIQAKCASKYEADPTTLYQSSNQTG